MRKIAGVVAISLSLVANLAPSFGQGKEYIRLNGRVIAIENIANGATCGTMTVPAGLVPGQTFTAAVAMQNSGGTTWDTSYALTAPDNTWGVSIVAVTGSVASTQTRTFSFTATAPATIGQKSFTWQMSQAQTKFGSVCTAQTVIIGVSPSADTVSASGTGQTPKSIQVYAPSASSWTASSDSASGANGWLNVSTLSSGTGQATVGGTGTMTLYLIAGANSQTASRTGTVTIAGLTGTLTYKLTQAAAGIVLTVDRTSISLPSANAQADSIAVTTNAASWTATSNQSWLTVSQASASQLSYSAARNPGGSRAAQITINTVPATTPLVIPVTQPGSSCAGVSAPVLDRTSDSSVPGYRTGGSVLVTAAAPWTAGVTSGSSWLSIGTGSGSGNVGGGEKLTYVVSVNASASPRTGTIGVTSCGLTTTFTVSQKSPQLSIAPNVVQLVAGGAQRFHAYLDGTPADSSQIVWAVASGSGTIDSLGNYQAPSPIPAGNTGEIVTATLSGSGISANASISWTIVPQPPTLVSVSPNGVSGAGALFTVDIQPANVGSVQLVFGDSPYTATANSCWMVFYPLNNAANLVNDQGGSFVSPVGTTGPPGLGTAGMLENNQCRLDLPSPSSQNTTATDLIQKLNMSFKAGFAGSHGIYLFAATSQANTDLTQMGSYTVTTPTNTPPTFVSLSPVSSSGSAAIHTSVFTDPDGSGDFATGEIRVTDSGASVAHACDVQYSKATNGFYLRTDDGLQWSGPYPAGTAFTAANGQCQLAGAGSSVAYDPVQKTMTLTTSLSFLPSFMGAKSVFAGAVDARGATNFAARGSINVSFANLLPVVVSLSPSTVTASPQALTATFSHPAGYAALSSVYLLIGTATDTSSSKCEIYYNVSAQTFALNTDQTGANWTSPLPAGSGGSITNSLCGVSGASAAPSGNSLVLTIPVTLSAGGLSGSNTIWMQAVDNQSNSTGWVNKGAWAASPPVTVTPGAATLNAGQTQQFAATVNFGSNSAVTWSVPSGVGTVNASGLYTAPSSVTTQQAVAVVAASVADNTKTGTATVTLVPPSFTVTTTPAGLSVVVDGVTYPAPQQFQWAAGSSHSISAAPTQAGTTGTQYVFSNWSDGGAGVHTVTAGSASSTITAAYRTQYYLATSSVPAGGGTVTPSSGWYDSGTSVSVGVVAASGYQFAGFSGDLSGTTSPQTITMSVPRNVTGNFNSIVTFATAPTGLSITIDGTSYSTPHTFVWAAGSTHTAVASTQSGTAGVQYVFASWSDGQAASHSVITPGGQVTYTANFTTQYQLSATATPGAGGSIALSPSGGWYAPNTAVQVTAAPNGGYQFSTFSGDLTGATNPQTITMATPKAITATFVPITTVTTSPSGLSIVVDGVSYTSPRTFQWTPGTSHTLATGSPQNGATGVRYVWSSWSDSGAVSHTVTASSAPATLTANFVTQYYLTTAVSPATGGTVTASNWLAAGTVVSVTASPQAGYSFSGFSGDLTGATNPQNLTMSAPKSVTATFSAAPITVTVSPGLVDLRPGQTQQFSASLTNTTNQAVTWSVGGGGTPPLGTISGTGLYTAPFKAYTYVQVTATSVADPSKSATVSFSIGPPTEPPQVWMSSFPSTAWQGSQLYTFFGQAYPGRIRTLRSAIGIGSSQIYWYQTNCSFSYDQPSNVISVYGEDWNGNPTVASATLGTQTVLYGYSCAIDAGGSSASISGMQLTLNVMITLPAGYNDFSGSATDYSGYDSGWAYFGRQTIYTQGGD